MQNNMKEISQAIVKVMEEINGVAKNMTVWSWQNTYKWVSDKDVKEKIRESMIKNWLSILPISVKPKIQIDRWEEVDSYSKVAWAMKTKQSIFTEVETKYILLHNSWESIELAWYWQGVDSQDKWAGKATTYALKNTLLNMFLVPTWVDTDDTHSDDLPVPKTTQNETKNWLNYETFKNIVEAGNTTEQQIANIIKEDWYTLSNQAKIAVRHYITTWEIDKNLFFKK